MVLGQGMSQADAWRAVHPAALTQDKRMVWATSSRAFRRAMEKLEKYPAIMDALGMDLFALGRKHKQLLNAKKSIAVGGAGGLVEVDDNPTQLAALELALKKRFPDPAPGGGFGNVANLQVNFTISHPDKSKDDTEWEMEAKKVLAVDSPLSPAPLDGTPTPNSE